MTRNETKNKRAKTHTHAYARTHILYAMPSATTLQPHEASSFHWEVDKAKNVNNFVTELHQSCRPRKQTNSSALLLPLHLTGKVQWKSGESPPAIVPFLKLCSSTLYVDSPSPSIQGEGQKASKTYRIDLWMKHKIDATIEKISNRWEIKMKKATTLCI